MKKNISIFFNILLAVLGTFFLIGTIVMMSPTVEYDAETAKYISTTNIGGSIFFGILTIICFFFPIKKIIKYVLKINKEKNDKLQEIKEEEEKRGIKRITNNVSIIEKEKIIILNKKEYQFKDILGYELIEDGNTITTTTGKKKASVGKAIIGGVLLGDAGAIIGGNSGKTNSKSTETQYCTNLKVKITINNLENPCEFIYLIGDSTNKESSKYKIAYENAQKIMSIIDVLTKRN